MRGLPPVPTNVAELTVEWWVDGWPNTTSWYALDVGLTLGSQTAQQDALSAFFSTCMPSLLELVHNNARVSTCRLRASGITTTEGAPPNTGTWSGGTPHNTALGLQWVFAGNGRRSWTLTYMPGVPDIFTQNGVNLSTVGRGNAQASATDFLNAFNAIVIPPGPPLVLGTLQRARNGVPLSHAEFAPFYGVNPSSRLVTIRRRIPRDGPASPF